MSVNITTLWTPSLAMLAVGVSSKCIQPSAEVVEGAIRPLKAEAIG